MKINKLLDTGGANGGNTKLRKTNNKTDDLLYTWLGSVMQSHVTAFRVGGLSLAPSDWACPASKSADCQRSCLMSAGRGKMKPVQAARERKRDWLRNDPDAFLSKLRDELSKFQKLCNSTGVLPVMRLNVISDIVWEKYEIPQEFPDIFFYDYTKLSGRLLKTPDNYRLMFSWSGAPAYQPSVERAMKTDLPMSVVFDMDFPEWFLGRPIYDGDNSDLMNLTRNGDIIALKAKGDAKGGKEHFIVNEDNFNRSQNLRAA